MPTLSIAILNWNGKEYLEECLASIPKDLQAERILVDNASTDDSWKIAEKYGFRVVHADNKHQFITGINTALKEATGDYILFSQGDVKFGVGCFNKLIESIKKNPISMIQPIFYRPRFGLDNAGMEWIWPGYGIGIREINRYWWAHYLFPHRVTTSITFITSRSVIDMVGLFDENFSPAYYEDCDYALRCKKIGVKQIVVDDSFVIHRHNESFSTVYKKSGISDICRKNRMYVINKHYRGFDRWLRSTVAACLDIVKKAVDVITNGRISPD